MLCSRAATAQPPATADDGCGRRGGRRGECGDVQQCRSPRGRCRRRISATLCNACCRRRRSRAGGATNAGCRKWRSAARHCRGLAVPELEVGGPRVLKLDHIINLILRQLAGVAIAEHPEHGVKVELLRGLGPLRSSPEVGTASRAPVPGDRCTAAGAAAGSGGPAQAGSRLAAATDDDDL